MQCVVCSIQGENAGRSVRYAVYSGSMQYTICAHFTVNSKHFAVCSVLKIADLASPQAPHEELTTGLSSVQRTQGQDDWRGRGDDNDDRVNGFV